MASRKCNHCGKTCYYAERQEKDGEWFHGVCLQRYLADTKKPLQGFYPGEADRVAGELRTPVSHPPEAEKRKLFCTNCGKEKPSAKAKFCPECGSQQEVA
eukprot:TRINITY_DN5112_c0_g1_i1.p4 TRINITY_DN5112_c0_g1~~TRINITY_DN5112_c0_g1_i1.p4  ORF type:complete len:100 (+),score=24.53 TRINITY_DN5112_c0_g1_i1:68-367(+)